MDIRSFKNSAGEVFVCLKEHSNSYRLFVNMIKGATRHPDTALRSLAQELTNEMESAKIEKDFKSAVPDASPSNQGIPHNTLNNITAKIDLLFKTIGTMKSGGVEQPQGSGFDPELLEVFGKRLEASLGRLISDKLGAAVTTPILPEGFTNQILDAMKQGGVSAPVAAPKEDLRPILGEIQRLVADMHKRPAPTGSQPVVAPGTVIDLTQLEVLINGIKSGLDQKLGDLKNLKSIPVDLSSVHQKLDDLKKLIETSPKVVQVTTEQIAPVSIVDHAPIIGRDKLILEKESAAPSSEPTAIACKDDTMRYPATQKKTQPKCFGKFLAGVIGETPCVSCVWVNECKSEHNSSAMKTEPRLPESNKPDCYGAHKGDLDCSMCQFDTECMEKS